ncbi:MAG TPA: DUF3429 domain-containing protein [Acetobacteraceae bacterium]|nr:DUF3429 domain-containing protein [Acetobacteraceae bacterium]
MPVSAILLAILGLAPFIGCGLAALSPHADTAARMLAALIAWSALVLGFVGGLHWGLVLRATEPAPPSSGATLSARHHHVRIGLAVVPLIVAWVALLLPLVAASWLALLLLIAAYIVALAAEHRLARSFALPSRYLWLRWGFTIVAVAMLTTVMTLRLLGQTIVF